MVPRRLCRGDVVGIVSPSNPVMQEQKRQLSAGGKILEGFGLRVRLGDHVYSNTLGYAATPQEKAADINEMFSDSSVRAIFCSQGGDSANSCLSYLDWGMITKNPKIFMGMSDITALLNAIYVKAGFVTFHGSDVMWGFGMSPTEYNLSEFQRRLMEAQIGSVKSSRERCTIRSGKAEGRLLGGNLRCLLKLAGTPFFPDLTGSILFLEAFVISPEGCHAMFHQLRQMGAFDKVKGVIIGYIDGLQSEKDCMQMESVLLEATVDKDFPILKTNDFGHNCPNTVLPLGAKARLDSDTQLIEIMNKCVQ